MISNCDKTISATEDFYVKLSLKSPYCFFSALVLAAFLLYLAPTLLDDYPSRDVAARYAPMAEAFAHGDFAYAFHPRLQCLHPLIGGCFTWLLGCDGFTGVKLASLLFFALCIFPLYGLFKELFDYRIALGGVIIYIFASKLARLGCSGLRESMKSFVILLLVYSIIMIWKNREQLTGYLWLGLGTGLAICTRNDLILFAALVLLFGGLLERCRYRLSWRTSIALLVTLVAGLPEFIINYQLTGMAVPGSRFIVLFEKAFQCLPTPGNVILLGGSTMLAGFFSTIYAGHALWRIKSGRLLIYIGGAVLLLLLLLSMFVEGFLCNGEMLLEFLYSLGDGFGGIFLPFAILGIVFRLRQKKWTSLQTVVFALFLLHQISVVWQIILFDRYLYVSSRYLLPATPLLFGWVVYCITTLWHRGKQYLPKPATRAMGCVLIMVTAFAFYADTVKPVWRLQIDSTDRRLKINMEQMAERIRTDYQGPRYFQPPFDVNEYVANVRPRIYFNCESKLSVTAYYAGAFSCKEPDHADYLVLMVESTAPAGFVPLGEPILSRRATLQIWKKSPENEEK